jgi:hypothetical protein
LREKLEFFADRMREYCHLREFHNTANPKYYLRISGRPILPEPLKVKLECRYGLLTAWLPVHEESVTRLHQRSDKDKEVLRQITADEPLTLTLQAYVLETANGPKRKLILNLVTVPGDGKFAVFATKSKKELAYFMSDAFSLELERDVEVAKLNEQFSFKDEPGYESSSESDA